MARSMAVRSVTGGSRTAGLPDSDTRDRLYWAGTALTKSDAASFAAASRFGLTSVAFIDSDVSITTTMVAALRGTRSTPNGRAQAPTRVIRLRMESATVTCRSQVFCLPSTRSRMPVLVNRMPDLDLRRTSHT